MRARAPEGVRPPDRGDNRAKTPSVGRSETDHRYTAETRRAVGGYLRAGLAVIPIPSGKKNPNRRDWQTERWSIEDVPRLWNNGQNVGILLGERSGGVCDVDLDSPEAAAVAPYLLPATLTSGRPSKPDSHLLYRANPVPETKLFKLAGKGDGRSVVELRSTGAQTLVPPSLHPSGERYSWGREVDVTDIDGAELLEGVSDVATAAELLRCYPGQGGRHDYALAAAGLLGRHMDSERVERIMNAVVAAAGDEEAESRARDVSDTLEKIRTGLPSTGGPTLDKLAPGLPDQLRRWHDWSPAEAERPPGGTALLARRVLLARDIDRGIEPPQELEPGVLLKGNVHQIFAAAGAGKTWVAHWLIVRCIERGERVLFLDMENGPRIVAERLEALKVDTSRLDELLFYLPSPDLSLASHLSASYAELLDTVKLDLVVFDSWINFLSAARLDENAAGDIASWANVYTRPARDRGITVVLLDHVPHAGTHARGSTRKKDEVDVQLRLSRTKPFSREKVGEIVLHCEKDREGWLPASTRFTIGSSGDGFVFRRSGTGTAREGSKGDALTDSQRKAFGALCSFGEQGVGFNEWLRAAGVSKATLAKAAKVFDDTGLVFKGEDKRYRATSAYRDGGTVGSLNHQRTEPNSGEKVRSGSPPLRGEPTGPPTGSREDIEANGVWEGI